MAADKRYAVDTQLKAMACRENSNPIVGKARLMAEPINGVKNEPKTAIAKATRLVVGEALVSLDNIAGNNHSSGISP